LLWNGQLLLSSSKRFISTAHSVKTKKVMGYLVNQTEEGICLIPIVSDTLTKNKVVKTSALPRK